MAGVYRNISGTWKSCTAYRNISGVWKRCTVWRNISGVWKKINPFAASANTPVSGGGNGLSTQVVTSTASTVTTENGVGPYTYSWSYVSGDNTITITTSGEVSTTFSKSLVVGASTSGVFKCTVTDTGTSDVVDTNNVSVSLDNFG